MTVASPRPETNTSPVITVDRSAPGVALNLPVEIAFDCFGRHFSVVARDTPEGAVVSVAGIVGSVPFSAEGPAARAMTRAMLERRPSSEIVRLELADRNRIALVGEAPLGERPSPAAIVAVASALVSAAKPLIDILAACGAVTNSIERDQPWKAAVAVS